MTIKAQIETVNGDKALRIGVPFERLIGLNTLFEGIEKVAKSGKKWKSHYGSLIVNEEVGQQMLSVINQAFPDCNFDLDIPSTSPIKRDTHSDNKCIVYLSNGFSKPHNIANCDNYYADLIYTFNEQYGFNLSAIALYGDLSRFTPKNAYNGDFMNDLVNNTPNSQKADTNENNKF